MKGFQRTLILLGVLVVSSATASEISGAFGFEFGAEVDLNKYQQLGIDAPYGLEYSFIPENPFAPLTHYSLFVTPKSHRVYKVTAIGKFTSDKACRRVLAGLEEALEKKYDKTSTKIPEDFGSIPKISFGTSSRSIEGNCSGFLFSKRLNLVYVDNELRTLAAQEYQQSLPSEKQTGKQGGGHDTSGL